MELLKFKVCLADEAVFYKVKVKEQMMNFFEIADLGDISWLLGINITQDLASKMILLGQQSYIEQIIAWFDLQNAQIAVTPMEPGINLTPN